MVMRRKAGLRGCNGGWDCRKSARAEVTGENISVGKPHVIFRRNLPSCQKFFLIKTVNGSGTGGPERSPERVAKFFA